MIGRAGRLILLLLVVSAWEASGGTIYRVLMVHSFGRDYAPFDTFSRTFRTELGVEMGGGVVFYDFDLESAHFDSGEPEGPFISYLGSLFGERHVDLIVPIGGPAVRFAQKHRADLFRATPMLISATDQRHVTSALLATNDSVVSVANDFTGMIASILQLLPATTNIAVVVGSSPLEKFWVEEMHREFQPFAAKVNFQWFGEMTFTEIQRRASELPAGSAIFYGLFYIDADGVPYPGERSLVQLHEVANAPIFGLHESQMGFGTVGGRLMNIEELGRRTATVAARILHGEPAGEIRTPPQLPGNPIFDWRELRRWGIRESSLPANSIIRFRQPTFWQLYKKAVLLGAGLLFVLLGGLYLRHVAQLRAAEEWQAALTRLMIVSQEDERRRIAGELHDGLGQSLILMKNKIGLLRRRMEQDPGQTGSSVDELARNASQSLKEVRAISQALRPPALEQAGVTAAIESMAREASESSAAKYSIEIDDVDGLLPSGMEINLFRIVQEGLNNIVKHAQARYVSVEVKHSPDTLWASIYDDGAGFDVEVYQRGSGRRGTRASLGLVSMTERAKLLGGRLEIKSSPGDGTRVELTIPLKPSRADNGAEAMLKPLKVLKALDGGGGEGI